jgi:hypothetical protein
VAPVPVAAVAVKRDVRWDLSHSPLKSPVKTTTAMHAIDEIATFSSVKMFAHLFDMPPTLVSAITQIENQCGEILRSQLLSDLVSGKTDSEGSDYLIRQSALEASLSAIFRAHSDFWEQYYRRINRRAHGMESSTILRDSDGSVFQNAARIRYPHFFVMMDVMHHVDRKNAEKCQLIQMSLQAYLKGLLLGACDRNDEMREAMAQALKLIGPLHVPEYRKVLIGRLGAPK